MKTAKKLGIWMDHSSAHITEFSTGVLQTTVITSKFTHADKELSLDKGESMMHTKEQHKLSAYYKELGEVIRNYDEVILFGPTDAKVELFNILKADHLFAKTEIELEQTDKMTEYQQQSFVKKYFISKN